MQQLFFLQDSKPLSSGLRQDLRGASQPQEGAAAQPLSHPQDGSAAAQPLSHPQDGSAAAAQPLSQQPAASAPQLASQHFVSQPQPLAPSIRSSKPAPKLWLQIPIVSTMVPISVFHFIEPCLLNDGTIDLAISLPPATPPWGWAARCRYPWLSQISSSGVDGFGEGGSHPPLGHSDWFEAILSSNAIRCRVRYYATLMTIGGFANKP